MAPLTADLGPLGGVVVIARFRSASVGKWTRSPLNPRALLSACFLTVAKYTRALCSARAQKYAGADIKRVLSKFLPMTFSATDVLPAWQRVSFSWMLWSSRNGEDEKREKETKLHECGPLSQSVIKGQLRGERKVKMSIRIGRIENGDDDYHQMRMWLHFESCSPSSLSQALRYLASQIYIKCSCYCNILNK